MSENDISSVYLSTCLLGLRCTVRCLCVSTGTEEVWVGCELNLIPGRLTCVPDFCREYGVYRGGSPYLTSRVSSCHTYTYTYTYTPLDYYRDVNLIPSCYDLCRLLTQRALLHLHV